MTVIKAHVTITEDHRISGVAPAGVPAGEHEIAITVGAPLARQEPTPPFDVDDLPRRDLGPWPEGLSLSREDLYGDDGR